MSALAERRVPRLDTSTDTVMPRFYMKPTRRGTPAFRGNRGQLPMSLVWCSSLRITRICSSTLTSRASSRSKRSSA